MKKNMASFATAGIIILLVLSIYGCAVKCPTGTIQLNLNNRVAVKTLLPDISMTIETYGISLTGPNGELIEEEVDSAVITRSYTGLAFGEWTVAVKGKNDTGFVIGEGEYTGTVHTNAVTVLDVEVRPLAGPGEFDLTVSWNTKDADMPSVTGQLVDSEGEATDLAFSKILKGRDTCTTSSLGNVVSAGYYTLIVKLLDSGLVTMGAVEVARIAEGGVTTGDYYFNEINRPGGGIQVIITPQMAEPVEVSLSGQRAEIRETERMALRASVPAEAGAVTYVWYVNGESMDAGPEGGYTVSGLDAGVYRLDVTAFTTDGRRAGSASHPFHVIEGTGLPAEPDVTIANYFHDMDVADDGKIAAVRYYGNRITLAFFNPDGTVLEDDIAVGTYRSSGWRWPNPFVVTSPRSQITTVLWNDYDDLQHTTNIKYRVYDRNRDPVVDETTYYVQSNMIIEFYDAAIDNSGRTVLAITDYRYDVGDTKVGFINPDGTSIAPQTAFDIPFCYGTHVAVNQESGSGIVTVQGHSGPDCVYYRRFNPDGTWIDPAPVAFPIPYVAWYDGHTVGMNGSNQFVVLWRSASTRLDAIFYDSSADIVRNVAIQTINFEGYESFYDSFRRRHQEIPVRDGDFILGEVYNWVTPVQNRTVRHFRYSPSGILMSANKTDISWDEGLTIRMDGSGTAYCFNGSEIGVYRDYLK